MSRVIALILVSSILHPAHAEDGLEWMITLDGHPAGPVAAPSVEGGTAAVELNPDLDPGLYAWVEAAMRGKAEGAVGLEATDEDGDVVAAIPLLGLEAIEVEGIDPAGGAELTLLFEVEDEDADASDVADAELIDVNTIVIVPAEREDILKDFEICPKEDGPVLEYMAADLKTVLFTLNWCGPMMRPRPTFPLLVFPTLP